MQLPRIAYLSVHTTFTMSVLLNLLSAHAQTFALFVVIAPVPYASLGEGRIVGDRSPSFHISCKASTRQGRSVLGRSRMTPPVRPRRPAPDQPAAGIFWEHLHRRTTAAGTSAVRGGRLRIHLPLGPLTSLHQFSLTMVAAAVEGTCAPHNGLQPLQLQ